MALFNTYRPPAASGVLGESWRKPDGKASWATGAGTGGLALHSRYLTYAAANAPYLATSLNHFDSIDYSEYWSSGSSGSSVKKPKTDIPRLKRKYDGTRGHLKDADHDAILPTTSNESLYFAEKKLGNNYHKYMSSRPMYDDYIMPPHYSHGAYTRDIYGEDDEGDWSVWKNESGYSMSGRSVSMFRMVYTDVVGAGDEAEQNVFLAFGNNGSHGTTTSLSPTTGRISNAKSHVPGGGTLNPLSNNHKTYVSNAGIVITFQEYCHYVGNSLGGTGLIDLTPFSITATAYMERNMKTDIYSPYGDPEIVDFGNQVAVIKLWPTKHLTGIIPE
jgi:hypothetical protein